jgi:hypothetical protein
MKTRSTNANGMVKYRLYDSSQIRSIYQYMNLKRKLLHCTANIKFNKTCIIENIIPKYAAVKIPGNTMASIITKQQVQHLRVQNFYTKETIIKQRVVY